MASIGIGNIGGEMFRLLKPFEMRLVAHDPYADPARAAELGVELVGLHEAFEQADFLAFNCPLNDGTRGIGGKDNIARMKPSAYLINTSRGPVVDQSALYDALVQGRLAGAAIDVFDPEPPSADEPIL
jgi:phosphoglycerate dehydrogenase-like enzyme